ncbi:MAG: winged helix-turn-helix domain-containing tetratricopeptide repeat protein [Geminicoccaceae bacterium]
MLLTVGSCVVDTATLQVRRDGELVAVQPKVFDLLVLLLSNSDRVVGRQEIVDKLWSGRVISDAALSTCIKSARRAIGDNGRSQQIIRTVRGRGLRASGPVVVSTRPAGARPQATDVADPAGARNQAADHRAELAALGLKPPRELSIAVLPFVAIDGVEGAQGFADGFVQDLITQLGRTRCLFVISRGTVFALRHLIMSPHEIGRALGVRYVLSGSLRYDGRRIRMNVSLADPDQPFEIWSERFDRQVADMFTVQEELAELIVGRAQSEITEVEKQKALMRPIADLDAWSAYYRASWHLDRHTATDYDQAETLLKLAARLDPGAARVHAGLSFVHRQRAFLDLSKDREGDMLRAIEFAHHSLALEPRDPQAHWAFGRALMLRNEVEVARQAFDTAASLNPSFAMGQYSLGFAQSMLGRTEVSDDALSRSRRLSPLDPMRFAMLATHAFNCAVEERLGRAVELARQAAAQPNAHYHIVAIAALCCALGSRPEVAARYMESLREVRPSYQVGDFFRAFPFQSKRHIGMFRRGFKVLGVPE